MLILISGPYWGGTNDAPILIKKNLDKLESVALPLFHKRHIPMIGEWVALLLMHLAGSKKTGIASNKEHPTKVKISGLIIMKREML